MVRAEYRRPDSGGRREGLILLDARRAPVPGFQQPVDVRQRRPFASARREGDSRAGGDPGIRESVYGDRAARRSAEARRIAPGDISVFFFTNGGAEANENAIKLARAFTGRHKILARYRSYHGATAGACR
jgi:hypothetical protein